MNNSDTPLVDALRRIRDWVSKNDQRTGIAFSTIHDNPGGTPAFDLDGEWIWRRLNRGVRVDLGARRGLDVFFMVDGRVVARRNFLVRGRFPVEERVGSRILAFLLR